MAASSMCVYRPTIETNITFFLTKCICSIQNSLLFHTVLNHKVKSHESLVDSLTLMGNFIMGQQSIPLCLEGAKQNITRVFSESLMMRHIQRGSRVLLQLCDEG